MPAKKRKGALARGCLPRVDLRVVEQRAAEAAVPTSVPEVVVTEEQATKAPRTLAPTSSSSPSSSWVAAPAASSRAPPSWGPSTRVTSATASLGAYAASSGASSSQVACPVAKGPPDATAVELAVGSTDVVVADPVVVPRPSRDFPVVAPRVRGSAPGPGEQLPDEMKSLHLAKYEEDKMAATAVVPRASQVATWGRFLALWHDEVVPSVPVEPKDIAYVGCLMKARGYRSFSNYVAAMKIEHVRAGFCWTAQHDLEATQGTRSVTRGQGPPRQAAPLIVDDVLAVDAEQLAAVVAVGCPINPKVTFFLGTAFMLREIELAYARLAHLRVDAVKKRATLELPVGKTDPTAVGCVRIWGCICDADAVRDDCVYHAAAQHLQVVFEVLEVEPGDPLVESLPLFPDVHGKTVAKAAVAALVEQLAELVQEPLLNAAGQRRFSGHSLRVSGAQWLGRLGFSVEQIQTFGRWASDVVVRYLGEAHVTDLARTRRGLIRDQAVLDGHALAVTARSGPHLQTPAHIEQLVQDALRGPLASAEEQFAALRAASGQQVEFVLHERYMRVHRLGCSLSEPSAHWATQCGWRFAAAQGWRLAKTAELGSPWRPCTKCKIG